jgi:hypothetical protein
MSLITTIVDSVDILNSFVNDKKTMLEECAYKGTNIIWKFERNIVITI